MKRFITILLFALCSISTLGQSSPYKLAGHEFVDLGLPSRTLWATCNVGASSPEEFGGYFAWGETATKSEYTWKTYKYYVTGGKRKEVMLNKYVFSGEQGKVDSKRRLDLSDDVAHTNWGSSWRMPTFAELKELQDECTWTWTTQGGRNGYKVTGKNGLWIFLPAAGIRDGKKLIDPDDASAYWTSELNRSADASHLFILHDFMHEVDLTRYSGLYYGFSVRPVFTLDEFLSLSDEKVQSEEFIMELVNLYATADSILEKRKASADSGNAKPSTDSASKSTENPGASSNTRQANSTKSTGSTISSGNTKPTAAAKASETTASSGSPKTASGTGSSTAAQSIASTNIDVVTKPSQSVNIDADDPRYNGHEYVDLGLDVKWATCNIGASSPNEYGYRFAWGATDPNTYGADRHIAEGLKSPEDYYRGYDWIGYKWGREESDGTVVFTKYYTERWENDKKVLDLSDDAAHVYWGGEWRMPTDEDFLQLIRNCNIKINPYTCIVTVTSKINGNVIYFPIVHLYGNEMLITHYWASTLDPYNNEKAFLVDFRHFGESVVYSSHRFIGYPVRPVIKR